jgi:hypothetical protein
MLGAEITTELEGVEPDDVASEDAGGTTTVPAVPAQPAAPPALPDPADLDRACVYAVDPPLPDLTAPADSPFGTGSGSGSAAAPGTISKSVTDGTFTRVASLPDGVGARLVLAAGLPSTPGLEQCDVTATSFATFPDRPAAHRRAGRLRAAVDERRRREAVPRGPRGPPARLTGPADVPTDRARRPPGPLSVRSADPPGSAAPGA